MTRRIQCLDCFWEGSSRGRALTHHLQTGHDSFYEETVEEICWSCDKRKTTIPVMFPESPEPGAPLKRHWWCEECAAGWLGELGTKVITTEVFEECARRGYREAQ